MPEPAKRDALWRVDRHCRSPAAQTAVFDELSQERLLAIAGSPRDIGALATAVVAPKCAMDGSPMITSQAATVLAAYRHLAGIVSVMSPDRVPEVMNNLATASLQLDPHVVMQVLQTEDDPQVRALDRQGPRRGVRRCEGRAAAGDGAGARRDRRPIGWRRSSIRSPPTRTASRACHDADAEPAERNRLRQGRPVSDALVVDGRAARLVQRQAIRVRNVSRVPRRRRRARRTHGRRRFAARNARNG